MLWRDSPRHTHHRRLFRSAPINASGFIDQQRCVDKPRLSAVAYGHLYMAADTSSACQLCAGGVYSAQHYRAFALVRIWSGVCSGHIKLFVEWRDMRGEYWLMIGIWPYHVRHRAPFT